MHFVDLGTVVGKHPDPPPSSATVTVTLVQDSTGNLSTMLAIRGGQTPLALLDSAECRHLAQLLLEAASTGW